MKLLLVVAAALAVASCDDDAIDALEFQAWQDQYRSSDNFTAEERISRMSIWLRNREVVLSHNAMADQGNSSYHLGMTNFADIENDEFKEMLSCRCMLAFNASRPRNVQLRMLENTTIPETFNWMDKGYVTPVKNQGNCGSCWAFSTTGALEGQTFRKTGKLVSLSEQQLVDCSGDYGNMGCSGGLMDSAFSYIQDNRGLSSEADYPYEAENGVCRHDPNNTAATCSGFVDIPQGDEEAMKEAVATVGPISVAIDASLLSFQLYKSGVYDMPFCSSTNLGHAVLVVGYGSENGKDYWLVKNSWGTQWGDQGYVKMRRNRNNQCGIATLSSYPLV